MKTLIDSTLPGPTSVLAPASGKVPTAVVIGAGLSGILMAIRLKQRGCDVRVIDKGGDVGGVWNWNRYPGIACDTTAHTYVYSFAPEADFTHRVAPGNKVQEYFRRVAEKYGVLDKVTLGTEVTSATWDGAAWHVETDHGERFAVDIVVAATGRLHHPRFPDIPGIDSFEGEWMHSSLWNSDVELTGKRVGLLGTGSTAAQIMSATVGTVDHLTVFQRSAQWVYPLPNYEIPADELDRLRNEPGYAKKYYDRVTREAEAEARVRYAKSGDAAEKLLANIRAGLDQVADPELRAKLTPDYPIGCKRLVVSEDYYQVVQEPNLEIETTAVAAVEPDGIRLSDGTLRELDVIIYATGFYADACMRPMSMTGKDGLTLNQVWADDLVSYRSVAIPGMPNFFMINGPFSPGGSAAYTRLVEIQAEYIDQLVGKVLTEKVALSPRLEASLKSIQRIRERATQSVLGMGCGSWALDEQGRPIVDVVLPDVLEQEMAVADFDDFESHSLKSEVTR